MLVHIIVEVLVGALVGYVAGIIMKCQGSFLRNVIIGVVGGALSGIVFKGWLFGTIGSVLFACVIIYLAKKFLK